MWSIQLRLYSASFTARDALFHFPIGSGIQLSHPDRRAKELSFDHRGKLNVKMLAPGLFHVRVTGARGIAPPTPLAMSRDQDVELLVLSYFDLTVMFGLMAALALGLLFFGRPQLLKALIALPGRFFPRARTRKLEGASIFENINVSALLACPACQATIKQGKAGFNRSGSQRYLCRVCSRVYTPAPTHDRLFPRHKLRVLQMYPGRKQPTVHWTHSENQSSDSIEMDRGPYY